MLNTARPAIFATNPFPGSIVTVSRPHESVTPSIMQLSGKTGAVSLKVLG